MLIAETLSKHCPHINFITKIYRFFNEYFKHILRSCCSFTDCKHAHMIENGFVTSQACLVCFLSVLSLYLLCVI